MKCSQSLVKETAGVKSKAITAVVRQLHVLSGERKQEIQTKILSYMQLKKDMRKTRER